MKAWVKLSSAILASLMSFSALSACTNEVRTPVPTATEGAEQTDGITDTVPATTEDGGFIGVTVTPGYTDEETETPSDTTPLPTITHDVTPETTVPPIPTIVPTLTPTPTPDKTPDPAADPTPTPTPTPDDTVIHADNRDKYKDAPYILKETKDGGLDYQNRVVFLGDSTTYGLMPYGVLPGGKTSEQVWYGPKGTLALFNVKTAKISCEAFSESMRIPDALAKYPPDILVITLGVNGVSSLDEEGFKEYYGWLIKTVFEKSPNTKIIAQSIYPISSFYQYQNTLNNKKITVANGWIRDLVSEYYNKGKAIYYLDTYNKLLDEHGEYMDLDYKNSASDGIHLNKTGHKVVLKNLRTHMIP